MKYTIELSPQDLQVVGNALGQRPYAEVAQVVAKIDRQVMAQQQRDHDKAADARDQPSGAPVA